MNKIHLFLWAFLFDISGVFSQTGCPVDYTVSQAINSATTISASNTLTANNFVNGGNDVQFTAGTSILFLPSFNIAASGSGKFSAYIQTCQASNPITPGPLYAASNFTKTVNTSLPVGTMAAAADVDLSGGATYAIPIAVPPGTNGVAPAIAVSYNSMGGNGILGQGWGLSGLSAISRTSKTIYHDVTANPIEFSANDRFALDGVRLVGVSGVYGANNTTYATESESFATITSYNGTFTGPGYFTVKHKSGVTYEYGNSGNSITTNAAGTQVLIWRLNKILYNDGNYIEFVYTNVNIQEIRYTGNSNTGLVPYNLIKFNYGTRPDQNTSYHAGAALPSDYLLDNITITAEGNTGFKTYQFNYGWDNINSYLNEVIEKGSDGSALNSTIFKYGDQPTAFQTVSSGVTVAYQDHETIASDFNSDGFTDILVANRASGGAFHSEFSLYKWNPLTSSFNNPFVLPLASFSKATPKAYSNVYTFFTNDFTGDGIDDIITSHLTSAASPQRLSAIKVYAGSAGFGGFPTPTVISPYAGYDYIHNGKFLYPGDFNGDGSADLITILGAISNSNSIGVHMCVGAGNNTFGTVGLSGTFNFGIDLWATADRIQIIDFNGDGKSDILVTRDNNSEIFTLDGYVLKSIYNAGFPTKWHLPFFGDFNGDRKTDILCRTSTTDQSAPWYKCISTGSVFNQTLHTFSHTPYVDINYAGDKIVMADLNGDGKTDIFHGWTFNTISTYLDAYYSKGNEFYKEQAFNNSYTLNTTPLIPFDINGDGKSELIARLNYTTPFDILYFKKDGKEMYLNKVKNGYEHNTEWVYKRMNEAGSFYAKGATTAHPVNNIQIPMSLVSELKVADGIGGINTIDYSYEEAKLHKEGKGLLGFLKVISHNQTTGYKTVTENEFNANYRSAAPKLITLQYVPNANQQINQTTLTNAWVSTGTGRFLQRVSSVSENKTFEGQTVTTSNTYDAYGNITTQTVNNNSVETATTTTVYGQHGTTVPALPTSVTNSITRTGQAAYSTTNTFAYNNLGQLTSKVDFSGLAKSVTTTYGYNSLGNLTSTIITPSGLTARSFSSVFDTKGRFATSTTDPLGTNTAVYDIRWGKPTSTTAVDGLTTTFTYDPFGRELTMIPPQTYSINTSYTWGSGYLSRHIKTITHPGKPDIKIYYDYLDREVRTETEGWQNLWITNETSYDTRGNVASVIGPNNEESTTNTYDEYNRLITSTNYKGGQNYYTTIGYTYSFGNLTTTITNPANQVSSKVTDASGKSVSASDNGGTLNYTYYSHGGLKTVINGATTLVTNNYDAYARQTSMVDINAGTTSYDYNALGQLTSQVNAKSQAHTMTYDLAGRMLTKSMPEGTTTYEYFPNGSGTSTAKLKKITGFASDLEEYTYDTYGRAATIKQTIDATAHTKTLTYNTYSDLASVTYPSSFVLNYAYDVNGYLSTIKNGSNTVPIFTTGTMNGYNQYKTYSLGNGKSSTNTYNSGIPTNYFTPLIQNLTFTWNYTNGNLTSRVDGIAAKTETFTYDNLNRLLTSAISGQPTQTVAYATNGNITSKTDAGTYAYTHATKINAVTQINPSAGNISSANQSLPTYTSFLQPSSLSEGSNVLNYTYGSDENRIKGVSTGSVSNTRYYMGDYEKDITGGATKHIHYISAGDGLIAIVIRENGNDTYYYSYTDHLGSILHVTNSAGTIIHNQNFDAWGRYRNVSNWSYTGVTAPPAWLTRGFTGHEHLPLFGLINMNGRLYDPVVGRMLAVDNNVSDGGSTQGFNRYSYALNNPLKYTDPDGENPLLIGALIGIAVNGISNLINHQNFFKGAIKAGIFGAIGGGISSAIGGAASAMTNGIERALFQVYAHGFSGAALSLAQGGNPVAGFLSGGISSGIGTLAGIANLGAVGQIIGGGLSGGLGSVIGGGRFWDGARQGLITGVLNHAAHLAKGALGGGGDPRIEAAKLLLAEQFMKGHLSQYEYILAYDILTKNWTGAAKDVLNEHLETIITLGSLGVGKFMLGMRYLAAKVESRAFFSGAGTEARAIEGGFQTIGQSRAGRNLQNLIDSKNIPWEGVGGAESMWSRLSATWAKGIPNGNSVPVFLNNPRAGSIWLQTELPILKLKGVKLIYK